MALVAAGSGAPCLHCATLLHCCIIPDRQNTHSHSGRLCGQHALGFSKLQVSQSSSLVLWIWKKACIKDYCAKYYAN